MDFQQKSTATPYAPAEGDRLPKKTIPRKYFSGGEQLTIHYTLAGQEIAEVYLEGPANFIYEGQLHAEALRMKS